MHKLFVYGTLKKGRGNYERFISPDPSNKPIGPALSVDADYAMAGAGIPWVYKGSGPQAARGKIRGELYEITDESFRDIDRLEGHPRAYKRQLQKFVVEDGAEHEAWIYLSPRPVQNESAILIAPEADGSLSWPSRNYLTPEAEEEEEPEMDDDVESLPLYPWEE